MILKEDWRTPEVFSTILKKNNEEPLREGGRGTKGLEEE